MIFELEHQFSHAVLAQHDSPFGSALILSYDGGGTDGAFNVRLTIPNTGPPFGRASRALLSFAGLSKPIQNDVAGAGLLRGAVQWWLAPLKRQRFGLCNALGELSRTGVHAPQPSGDGLSVDRVANSGRFEGILCVRHCPWCSTLIQLALQVPLQQLKDASEFLALPGKLMAYSAFGQENSCILAGLLQMLDMWHNGIRNQTDHLRRLLDFLNTTCALNVSDLYRWDGQAGEKLAFNMQLALETLVLREVRPLMQTYRSQAEGLTIVGGCALNVKINSMLAAEAAQQGWLAHVPAAPSDAGVMVGAALAVSASPFKGHDLAFTGPSLFDLPDLPSYVESRSARAVEASSCADLLTGDRVVAVMRGRTGTRTALPDTASVSR
jgi:hypothetical protein